MGRRRSSGRINNPTRAPNTPTFEEPKNKKRKRLSSTPTPSKRSKNVLKRKLMSIRRTMSHQPPGSLSVTSSASPIAKTSIENDSGIVTSTPLNEAKFPAGPSTQMTQMNASQSSGTSTPSKKKKKATPKAKKFLSKLWPSTPKNQGKAFDQPRPASPRVLVDEYMSRGLLEPVITIDDTPNSPDSPPKNPAKKRKAVFDRLGPSVASPPPGSLSKMLPAAKVQSATNDTDDEIQVIEAATGNLLEEGEIPNGITAGNLGTTGGDDIEIVYDAAHDRNPQSIFSRWDLPGRNSKPEVAKTGRRKSSISHKKRLMETIQQRFRGGDAQWAQKRKNIHYATQPPPQPPPVFDPNAAPNYVFSADLYSVPNQVVTFNARKSNFPRMGIRSREPSQTRLRSPDPCAEPPMPPPSTTAAGSSSLAVPSTSTAFHNVLNAALTSAPRVGLRPIIIDGQNVAFSHHENSHCGIGQRKGPPTFSSRGIDICIDYFRRRGHKNIIAFVPHFRFKAGQALDYRVLHKLKEEGYIVETPNKTYDDRYIVQYASVEGGIVVSNDNYNDLLRESPAMEQTIRYRRLPFTFIRDVIMFPEDPLGRHGPNLADFLSF